jgi:acetyl esterase
MTHYLDPINQAFADAGVKAGGPPLESLSYTAARQILEDAQKHVAVTDVTREEVDAPVGPNGSVKTFIYKPSSAKGKLPTVFYFHGGGWILGSPETHDSLVRDLVRESGAAIIFPYFTPAPEAKFPTQFEEVFGVIKYFVENGAKYSLVTDKIAFAGDSVGGKHVDMQSQVFAHQRNF